MDAIWRRHVTIEMTANEAARVYDLLKMVWETSPVELNSEEESFVDSFLTLLDEERMSPYRPPIRENDLDDAPDAEKLPF